MQPCLRGCTPYSRSLVMWTSSEVAAAKPSCRYQEVVCVKMWVIYLQTNMGLPPLTHLVAVWVSGMQDMFLMQAHSENLS
jgi:hypothetical protein